MTPAVQTPTITVVNRTIDGLTADAAIATSNVRPSSASVTTRLHEPPGAATSTTYVTTSSSRTMPYR